MNGSGSTIPQAYVTSPRGIKRSRRRWGRTVRKGRTLYRKKI